MNAAYAFRALPAVCAASACASAERYAGRTWQTWMFKAMLYGYYSGFAVIIPRMQKQMDENM